MQQLMPCLQDIELGRWSVLKHTVVGAANNSDYIHSTEMFVAELQNFKNV